MSKRIHISRCIIFAIIITAAAFVLGGCVERKLTIISEPAGSLVLLNDEQIGATPVTVEFNWYGDYRIDISKQGYETLNTHREIKAPLHDKFPLDFFYGVLWPGQIVDEYEWSFELKPYTAPDRDALIQDGEKIRARAAEMPEEVEDVK